VDNWNAKWLIARALKNASPMSDLSTFVFFPWTDDSKEARLIYDVYKPDGTSFEGYP